MVFVLKWKRLKCKQNPIWKTTSLAFVLDQNHYIVTSRQINLLYDFLNYQVCFEMRTFAVKSTSEVLQRLSKSEDNTSMQLYNHN